MGAGGQNLSGWASEEILFFLSRLWRDWRENRSVWGENPYCKNSRGRTSVNQGT
jgi:hypothetical protein